VQESKYNIMKSASTIETLFCILTGELKAILSIMTCMKIIECVLDLDLP